MSMWNTLNALPTVRESDSSRLITDQRITANGLAIRLCAGKLWVLVGPRPFRSNS